MSHVTLLPCLKAALGSTRQNMIYSRSSSTPPLSTTAHIHTRLCRHPRIMVTLAEHTTIGVPYQVNSISHNCNCEQI